MADKHKLSFTAAEIDERMRTAGEAVLYTPQTLTPEQQAQARKNIGVTNTSSKPIAYLYNGIELPPLPNWDKETYPYAVISLRESIGLYYLSVHKELRYFESPGAFGGEYITYFGDRTPGTALLYTWQEGMAAWELFDKDNWSISVERDDTGKDIALWANFDLLDDAGELYVGASEPVPVYPEGGGADLSPVIIDLDTYGGGTYETSVSGVLISLLFNGGGKQQGVEMGNLFSDLTTDRPIRIQFSLPYDDVTMAQVTVDSITTIRIDGQVVELYLNSQYTGLGVVASALAYINAGGTVLVNLIVPGADNSAIVADMEAILNAEY